jgi:hypothetical protein
MSIAHRFGREGHAVALISRSDARHAGYLAELAAAGVKAEAFVANVQDPGGLRSALDAAGPAEIVYYGPNSVDAKDFDAPGRRSTSPPPTTFARPWPGSTPPSTSCSTCCRA